ncbi:hypothetical protein BDZ94DRAFT_1253864 [Collybia nuda]|uniref:Uncharacterized protein n=1 Tax=Collybia nuda TaxID=64659 RepID=A0A9P6CM83_9AGAR|nr:hypothetical protein BDZ94DRAFT_1253864 [Collybia nuda]
MHSDRSNFKLSHCHTHGRIELHHDKLWTCYGRDISESLIPTPTPPSAPFPFNTQKMPILGGFVITPEESLKWASRIANKPVCEFGTGISILLLHMDRNGFDIPTVCYPAGVPKVMVVTQYGPTIEGWKSIIDDPTALPQFREGELERMTRKALDKAGVVSHQFVTSHGQL